MKIVPTTYEDLGGTKIVAYQYTYAYRSYVAFGHGGKVIPAVWFRSEKTCTQKHTSLFCQVNLHYYSNRITESRYIPSLP